MYKDSSQMRIEDFVFPYGELDRENDWVKLAARYRRIRWKKGTQRNLSTTEYRRTPVGWRWARCSSSGG